MTAMCSPKPVSRLFQRSPRVSYKPAIVLEASSSCALDDVGANTIRGANQLFPNCLLRKMVPATHHSLHFIGQLFGELINREFLKIRSDYLVASFPKAA
jgi:hypothetical protein